MSSSSRPRLVCRCLGVASPRIFAAARDQTFADVAAVTKAVQAGGGCTLCHPEIEEILAEVRGDAIDPALATENQLVCHQETLARIEGALAALVAPRVVAGGARVSLLHVDGLLVRLRITGSADRALPRFVVDALRRAVCEDLDVRVEIAS